MERFTYFNYWPLQYNFEPIATVKAKWLQTRKNHALKLDKYRFFGAFSTYDFPKDRNFTFSVFVIELMGILYGLYKFDWMVIIIIFSLLAIGLDLFLVYISHFVFKSKIILLQHDILSSKLEIVLHTDQAKRAASDTKKTKLIKKLIWNFIFQYFFKALIVTIAIIKVWAIWNRDPNSVWTFIVIASYLYVSICHVWFTGYCFAHWSFNNAIKKHKADHLIAISSDDGTIQSSFFENIHEQPIDSMFFGINSSTFNFKSKKLPDKNLLIVSKLSVDKIKDTPFYTNDTICTLGILTDEEIYNMAQQIFNDRTETLLFIYFAIKMQRNIVGAAPLAMDHNKFKSTVKKRYQDIRNSIN